MADDIFEQESAFFEEHREGLVHVHGDGGWFALVKGRELVGVHPAVDQAYQAGIDRFGLEKFMIKEILKEDRVIHFGPFKTRGGVIKHYESPDVMTVISN